VVELSSGAAVVAPTQKTFSGQEVAKMLLEYLSQSWKDDYLNSFCTALLCNKNYCFSDQDARALYEAYATLAEQHGKSAIWIHRVLNLYLSMTPYHAHSFLTGIKEKGQPFVVEFFQSSGLGAIAEDHPEGVVDEALVRTCREQMQQDLEQWKSRVFAPEKEKAFKLKDARPDLPEAYREAYGSIEAGQQDAIAAAEQLFLKGQHPKSSNFSPSYGLEWEEDSKESHVLWPYCLWKALPVPGWEDVLRPYYPHFKDNTVQAFKEQATTEAEQQMQQEIERLRRRMITCEMGKGHLTKEALNSIETEVRSEYAVMLITQEELILKAIDERITERWSAVAAENFSFGKEIEDKMADEYLLEKATAACLEDRSREDRIGLEMAKLQLKWLKLKMVNDWVLDGNTCCQSAETGRLMETGEPDRSLLARTSLQVEDNYYLDDTYHPAGIQSKLQDNPESWQKGLYAFAKITSRFLKPTDGGLKLMYALGRFLHAVRKHGSRRFPKLTSIWCATGAGDLEHFLTDDVWMAFIAQVMDNSVDNGPGGHERCSDGIYTAFATNMPKIIQPELPSELHELFPVFLWLELSLQEYRRRWMGIFDSHISSREEERTYGPTLLGWTVNPVFALPKMESLQYELGYNEGRLPAEDCLIPFKTGKFPQDSFYSYQVPSKGEEQNEETETVFLSHENKKNTTIKPQDIFSFIYATPFSPVEILYREARALFRKRIINWDSVEKGHLDEREHEVFDTLLRLLLARPEVRDEFLTFIAPFPDADAAIPGDGRWETLAPSFHSVLYQCTVEVTEDLKVLFSRLDQHLRYWKMGVDDGEYFYPSVEACKLLAVDLGYAREGSDLQDYQYTPPKADLAEKHNKPAPPPDDFYKHWNVHGERLDIDPETTDSSEPRSSQHKKNKHDPLQPKEPEAFVAPWTQAELMAHADERQQLFYQVCYPEGNPQPQPQIRTQEQIEAEWREAAEEWRAYLAIRQSWEDKMIDWDDARSGRVWDAVCGDDPTFGDVVLTAALYQRLQGLAEEFKKLDPNDGRLKELDPEGAYLAALQAALRQKGIE